MRVDGLARLDRAQLPPVSAADPRSPIARIDATISVINFGADFPDLRGGDHEVHVFDVPADRRGCRLLILRLARA